MKLIKQKSLNQHYITINKFAYLYIGISSDLSVLEFCTQVFRLIKNQLWYDNKDFSKILHGEQDWQEPTVKIVESYHKGVASLYFDEKFVNNNNFFKRNTGNQNFLKNSQNPEMPWQNWRPGR